MSAPVNLLDFDRNGLEGFFRRLGEKPFRARQLMQWVHQRREAESDLHEPQSELRRRARFDAAPRGRI